jgi:hypothetical protein
LLYSIKTAIWKTERERERERTPRPRCCRSFHLDHPNNDSVWSGSSLSWFGDNVQIPSFWVALKFLQIIWHLYNTI